MCTQKHKAKQKVKKHKAKTRANTRNKNATKPKIPTSKKYKKRKMQ